MRSAGFRLSHHRCACRGRRSRKAHDRSFHRASCRLHGISAFQESQKHPGEVEIGDFRLTILSSQPSKDTITATMARWAAGLQFKKLSPDAIYQSKRFLLDSFGCALGGYQQHDVSIALDILGEIAG